MWFHIFGKYLGKSSRQKFPNILLDLICVSAGFKLSLLFDYACVQPEKLHRMCSDLFESGLLVRPLDVLQLKQDIVICRVNYLLFALKQRLEQKTTQFIDVSGQLKDPCIMSRARSKELFAEMQSIIENVQLCTKQHEQISVVSADRNITTSLSPSHCLLIKLENGEVEDVNLCSVFGFLLDYPVVYWQSNRTVYNCLEMSPLRVYRMRLKISDRLIQRNQAFSSCIQLLQSELRVKGEWFHVLYSFSAPAQLEELYKEGVSSWARDLKDQLDPGLREFVKFGCDIVMGQQVAL